MESELGLPVRVSAGHAQETLATSGRVPLVLFLHVEAMALCSCVFFWVVKSCCRAQCPQLFADQSSVVVCSWGGPPLHLPWHGYFFEINSQSLIGPGRPILPLGWALSSFLCKLIEPTDEVFSFAPVLTLNFLSFMLQRKFPGKFNQGCFALRWLCGFGHYKLS